MKKAYEEPTVTIARFDVEEWLKGHEHNYSGYARPINPGHHGQEGTPPHTPHGPHQVPCPQFWN